MPRRTWIAAAVAAASMIAAVVLYLDNRRLEREVSKLRAGAPAPPPAADPWASAGEGAGDGDGGRADLDGVARGLGGAIDTSDRPDLPDAPRETRLQRRVRRQQEIAALLGRLEGESEQEYRDRVMPLVETMLSRPRDNVAKLRAEAEAAAGVTPEQRAQLDAAFQEVYDELLTYTNAAVTDGQLSPYERNVAGILEYTGGLGAILGGAEGRIGQILTPEQVRIIYDSGFEWAEYLGVSAPWEQLQPPPPPPPGGGSGG